MGSGIPKKNFLIRLSSKGLCFICLRDTAITDHGNDPPEARLRNITRFLGIDTKAILRDYFTCELSKCEGVKVKLCVECSSVMEKFSCLYQTLEITRLKLNQCLDRIQELIGEADRDHARVEEMKERVTHAPTAGVMEEMRRRVFERCLKTMNGAPPRVIVERVYSKEPDIISASSEVPDNLEEEDEVEAGSSLAADGDEDPVSTPPEPETAEEISEPPQPSMILRPRRSPRVTTGPPKKPLICPSLCMFRKNKFFCPCCGFKGDRKFKTQRHIAAQHYDQYFVEHRLPSVSSELFQKIVSNALFEGMFESQGARWRCNICSQLLAAKAAKCVSLKLHLVKRHYEQLVEKLVKLQRDPGILNEVEKEPKPSSSTSIPNYENGTTTKKLSCPHCRAVMMNSSNIKNRWFLYAHLVRHHLEKYFEPEDKYKEKSLTSLQFKQILYHLLFQSIGLKKGKEVKCRWCSTQYNFGSVGTATMLGIKIHLLNKHHNLLCEQLRELQTGPELAQKLKEIHPGHHCKCGAYIVNSQVLRAHQTKFCNLGNKKVFAHSIFKKVYMKQQISGLKPCTCSLCKARIPARTDKRQHVVIRHCEQYFLDYRDSNISVSAFKTLIDLELFKHLEKKEGRFGCPHCSKESSFGQGYKGKSALKIHMIEFHFEELVQRLRELQRVCNAGGPNDCETSVSPSASTSSEIELEFSDSNRDSGASSDLSLKNESKPSKKACPHCKAAFDFQGDLNRHSVTQHLEKFFVPEEEFKVASLSSEQFKRALYHCLFNDAFLVDSKKCPDCAKTFDLQTTWFVDLKLHMIQEHYTSLTEKLRTLQMDPEVQQKFANIAGDRICECGQYFVRMWVYNIHRRKFCKLLKESSPNEDGAIDEVNTSLHLGHQEDCRTPKETRKHDQNSSPSAVPCEGRKGSSHAKPCPHCKAVIHLQHANFMTRTFENHLLHHHLETYFLPEEEFKEPSLSSFQFKQVLEHLLFEYIETSDKVNGTQQCPHCPRTFKLYFKGAGLLYFKLHLIKDHHEPLTKRLKELQKNPEAILAKLERTNGFACKCGAYFSSGRVYHSHQRKFCNLLDDKTTSNEEGTTDVTGNIPDHSKGLEVDDDDDEDECALLLPQNSESEQRRDPLALEYENKCEVDDEAEPEGTDLKSVEIDIEEFVLVGKVEEEAPLVKIERKRRTSDSDATIESESSPPKVSKITSPTET